MPLVRHLIGLLAVLSILGAGAALTAAPVAGQAGGESHGPAVIKITSATTAGTYKVSWRTLGGCDPGTGTSGMAGEIILVVESTGTPDDTPTPGELTGEADVGVVVTRETCIYAWSVSFVEATTDGNCIVGPAPFEPDDNNEIRITLVDPATSCTQQSRIVVRLHPTLPLTVDDTDHNALLRSRFIATARRVADAPRRCTTRTAVSKVDDNETPGDTGDDTVSLELRVVATTAAGEECRYDVTLRVPRRLAATRGDQEHAVFENIQPPGTIDFSVGVATKKLYLLQTVAGDSGSANARYSLEKTCGEPDPLPEPLLPLPSGGGIQALEHPSLVELREGRYNITAAIAEDPAAPGAFDGIELRVLDNEGETCEATVTVLDLPERCTTEESSLTVSLPLAPDPTIVEFEITCGDDVASGDGDETDGEETNGDGADGDQDTDGDPNDEHTGSETGNGDVSG